MGTAEQCGTYTKSSVGIGDGVLMEYLEKYPACASITDAAQLSLCLWNRAFCQGPGHLVEATVEEAKRLFSGTDGDRLETPWRLFTGLMASDWRVVAVIRRWDRRDYLVR